MPSASELLYYAVHPNQLRSIIQWKVWHSPVHERNPEKESPELRRCFDFLDQTSRSFSAVIKELHPELLVPVALFYLILRGLDTIEDDMSIDLAKKEPVLRTFQDILDKEGWTFKESGPNEKDRQLLVEFDVVITEFAKTKPAYRVIIKDITKQMGNGMADYANNAEHNTNGVNTVEEYDLYCHYVAGLVGEGLTRLFVESSLANPALLERSHLHESMGCFLQKTNIIRDIREDFDDGRRFWPKMIWSKHVNSFGDLFARANEDAALNCISEMCLNSLRHADECLFYLAGLKEQSVFNFCAIPQVMAIATLELVFRNPNVYQRNVKITKGDACQLMVDSTNLRSVCEIFRMYVRRIHKKNTPKDPNFLNIGIACAKIEQFIENIFPTQDPRAIARARGGPVSAEDTEKAKDDAAARKEILYVFLAVIGTLLLISLVMVGVAYLAGARFDIALSELKKGKFSPPAPGSEEAQKIILQHDRGEL
ncbi:Delta(24)-sterol C-methyltransferase [Glutinoglossum americanum]|uniref:Squalene synthase n=1 Tax=Glutinoglossum americanum TaxID=1670608 RepID=A0A9P8HWS6_9PEZI|nr:Delta(24)-sterol C-methyltransferase [Glutinoglossum americanum]